MSHPNQMAFDYALKNLNVAKTLFSKEEKAKRKHTIKVQEWMRTRDNVLGIRPTPPPQVIHHPRFFNPPLSCRDGHHKWYTKMLMGIPILKCRKCGRIVMKGSFEGTETKEEIRTRYIPDTMPIEKPVQIGDLL